VPDAHDLRSACLSGGAAGGRGKRGRTIAGGASAASAFFGALPGEVRDRLGEGVASKISLEIIQLSRYGFQAHALVAVPIGVWGEITIQLGPAETSQVKVAASRVSEGGVYGFRLGEPDLIWRKFVNALYSGSTHADLENATRFMTDR
jgi:hypothetical protein